MNYENDGVCSTCNQTKVLADNQSGYLVGSRLSLADVGLMESLLMTADYFSEEPFQDYPHVKVRSMSSDLRLHTFPFSTDNRTRECTF